ncbi:MAG: CPBP family intramembrane metalloprotease [Phycisphaeraceae bacterium]|nr:MAG: CPBP family intramembrane metalloprotease [Phycisphaeraceae bacterium]
MSTGRSPSSSGRSTGRRGAARRRAEPDTYYNISKRPLHVLVFLAPLLVLYELGAAFYLAPADGGAGADIRARRLISIFFDLFGVTGLILPGLALVVVLLVWHTLKRDRWSIEPRVIGGMAGEAILFTLPLLVFAQLVGASIQANAEAAAAMAAAGASGATLAEMPWQARATIALGAGLYEELLFRMVGIALIHVLLVDLLGVKQKTGTAVSVVLTAIAFALYHDQVFSSAGIDLLYVFFYFVAGLYFGAIFIFRGFGIVVATHALYDLVVLLLQ